MRKLPILLALLIASSAAVYAGNARTRSHQLKQWLSVEDVQAEITFGREVAARIIGRYSLYEDKKLTRYLNLVAKSLAQYSSRPELDFVVGLLDTEVINAYAAPGGFIFITKGALDAMENESELASVIAHEIIHISKKHIVNELNIKGSDTSAVSGFGRLIGGATDAVKMAFTKAVDQAVEILFETGYKKSAELEADSQGVLLASMLGYDPGALMNYFRKVGKIEGDTTAQFKKLYPPFDDRIRLIQFSINEAGIGNSGYKKGKERFNANKK